MAILQGSEVAYVERALVRAPATFLGYEARKEGHHFRSCKPGLCLAFVLLHAPQLLHGAIRRLFRGPRNKKPGQDATFLRLRIVGWCQNADRGLKMQSTAAKRPFSALREWKRVRNRKKVAETSGFLFLRWAEIAVMRQTSRKYAKSAAAATAATAATATATVRAEDQTPI